MEQAVVVNLTKGRCAVYFQGRRVQGSVFKQSEWAKARELAAQVTEAQGVTA